MKQLHICGGVRFKQLYSNPAEGEVETALLVHMKGGGVGTASHLWRGEVETALLLQKAGGETIFFRRGQTAFLLHNGGGGGLQTVIFLVKGRSFKTLYSCTQRSCAERLSV